MTLTTHAIIGAAFAQVFPDRPVTAFCVGFVSHFAADALPHWDYQLKSRKADPNNYLNSDMPINRAAIVDLVKIGFDFWLGIGLSLLIFASQNPAAFWATAAGALGGILPDPLQFAY